MHYDYIILGAGISGLTFGRLLQQHTGKTFLILDKESEAGGLCRTKEVNGMPFDTGGGHFLYSKHQKVYDFVFSHVPQDKFIKYDRLTKIKIHDTYIDYPIEENLWQLPPGLQYKYVMSVIVASRSFPLKGETESEALPRGANFREWAEHRLGKEILDNYLIPYNSKIWGLPMEQMSTEWLYKIPQVSLPDILKSIVFRESGKHYPGHPYFYYPKRGGFQIIPDAIYECVKDSVRLNEPVCTVIASEESSVAGKQSPPVWQVNGQYTAQRIISTVPWTSPVVRDAFRFPACLDSAVCALHHNSIVVSMQKANYSHNWNWQWCYIPRAEVATHREFYLNNYVRWYEGFTYVAHETNLNRWKKEPQHEYHYINDYAYPIPTLDYKKSITAILEYYRERNLHGLGRWGTWEYHNSDICILKAMELFNQLEEKNV